MVRRFPNQVHKQAARLLRGNALTHMPVWYSAVLEHPPLPLPARGAPPRTEYDSPKRPTNSHKSKPPATRAQKISYIEDDVRRQFFHDHPFEAFRERTLVESGVVEDQHPVHGVAWKRLSQRGRNPSSEFAVKFAVNLHQYHQLSLSRAYQMAVMQFRSLRSEHHMATMVAVSEAEAYGAQFGRLETEKLFDIEEKVLESWNVDPTVQASLESRKRWRTIIERTGSVGEWTRGEEYVRLWKEGIRPDYAPVAITASTENLSAPQRAIPGSMSELTKPQQQREEVPHTQTIPV